MQNYSEFIDSNITIIIFAYGLTFFCAGLVIALQPLKLSKIRLARHLWLLAAFGLIHGVAEWGHIFIPIQSPYISELWISRLWDLQHLMWAISYIFLLQFGVTVINYHLSWGPAARSIFIRFPLIWGFAIIITEAFIVQYDYGQSTVRYLLGFPAAVLTAAAFLAERHTFSSYQSSSRIYMTLIAGAFGFYAILGGLTVPDNTAPGLEWLNYESVLSVTKMPIYFWRMIVGLFFTIMIIQTLRVFDIEYSERLVTAEAERALIEERQRIARDLHDGVVQTIYASGLQLEVAASTAATEPEKTELIVRRTIVHLNEVITNIRRYIYNLAAAGVDEAGFEKHIRKIADEYSAAGSITVNINIEGEQNRLTPKQKQNIAFITQECLSNVVKHAGASKAEIKFNFTPEAMVFTLEDDGAGFNGVKREESGQNGGRGLKSIRERVEAIEAELVISDNPGKGGTIVSIRIPYKKEARLQ